MRYVDSYVLPVPKNNLQAYRRMINPTYERKGRF